MEQMQSPQSRWRLQFSLWTLLLVAIIACVVAAYFGTAWRLAEASATISRQKTELATRDAEIAKLNAELGKLIIQDPGKVHILALPSKEDWHWRWRVYLPPSKTWKITEAVGEKVPKEGFDMSQLSHSASIGTEAKSEFTAEVWLARDINGKLILYRQFGDGRSGIHISPEDAKKLLANGSSSSHDPAGPIELLRLHKFVHIQQPDGSSASPTKPDLGILLFFEEAKQK
jgi:hypothetical protein